MSRSLSPADEWKVVLKRSDYAIQAASIAILYYDYLLTLSQEIQYVWKGSRKTSTILYCFCRYAMVANMMYLMYKTPGVAGLKYALPSLPSDPYQRYASSCKTVNHTAGILAILGHIGILGVWGLRTVAICNENRWVPWILSLFGATIIALRIVGHCADSAAPKHLTSNRQVKSLHAASGQSFRLLGITLAVGVMGFEALAFGLAAFRVWKTVRDDRKFWSNPQTSINYVIFSQGFLYIAAVFGLSIITAIFNLKIWGGLSRPLNSLKLPYATFPSQSLSGLLTARFLLRLRSWEHRTREATEELSAEICFGSAVGGQQGTSEGYGNETGLSHRRSKSHAIRSRVSQFAGNVGPALDPNDKRVKSTMSMSNRPSLPLELVSEGEEKV